MKRRPIIALFVAMTALAACGTRVSGTSASARNGSVTKTSTEVLGDQGAVGDAGAGGSDQAASSSSVGGPGSSGAVGTAGSGSSGSGSTSSGRSGGSAASGSPIVIGAVGDRSGVTGQELTDSWSGLDTWVAAVNSSGGIGGRPVKVIPADDGTDPGKYAAAIRQLITNDHVVAFVGNLAPLTFSAGTSALEQYGVPAIGGDSSDPGWFNSPMAFPINSVNIPLGRAPGLWGGANLKQSKAAVYYINEAAATTTVAQSFVGPWKAAGKQVVAQQGVSLATPDFTSEVVQAQGAGADVVMLVLDGASCSRFFEAARRQHYKPLFIADGCDLGTLKANADMTANNTYLGDSHRTIIGGTPAQDEFIRAANRFNPGHDLGAAALTWMSGKLFEAAVAAGGGATTADILRGLHGLKDETLGGLIPAESWGPGNHAPGQCGMVEFFDGQRVTPVTPDFVC